MVDVTGGQFPHTELSPCQKYARKTDTDAITEKLYIRPPTLGVIHPLSTN